MPPRCVFFFVCLFFTAGQEPESQGGARRSIKRFTKTQWRARQTVTDPDVSPEAPLTARKTYSDVTYQVGQPPLRSEPGNPGDQPALVATARNGSNIRGRSQSA